MLATQQYISVSIELKFDRCVQEEGSLNETTYLLMLLNMHNMLLSLCTGRPKHSTMCTEKHFDAFIL